MSRRVSRLPTPALRVPHRLSLPARPRRLAAPAPVACSAPGAWLALMRLASPGLPVGAFSYSEGLEAALDAGLLTAPHSLRAWLLDQLMLVQARTEMPVIAQAQIAWRRADVARLQDLQQWSLETRETRELRAQSLQMGRALTAWLRVSPQREDTRLVQLTALEPAPTWPMAFALAAVLTGALDTDGLAAYALGWCESMVQTALKAVPLGQTAGQALMDALVAQIPGAVTLAATLSDAERGASAPMLAILSAHHEHQYARLFRS